MVGFRFHWTVHLNTWGCISIHFCLSCCFTVSGAKIQSMACWESFQTASRLRPNVEAASWYSWDKSVQKTPLSSVCNVTRNKNHSWWTLIYSTLSVSCCFVFKTFKRGYSIDYSLLVMRSTTHFVKTVAGLEEVMTEATDLHYGSCRIQWFWSLTRTKD